MRKIATSLMLAGVGTLALLLAVAPASAAKCKSHPHSGFRGKTILPEAQSDAIKQWAKIVQEHDGAKWASWSEAKNKTLSCTDYDPSLKLKNCTATATPCKKKGGSSKIKSAPSITPSLKRQSPSSLKRQSP